MDGMAFLSVRVPESVRNRVEFHEAELRILGRVFADIKTIDDVMAVFARVTSPNGNQQNDATR